MTEHPTPDPVRLAFADKYDDAHAEYYYRKHRNGLSRRLSHLREAQLARQALRLAGDSKEVLDLPCGAGRFWDMLLESPERQVIAADNSESMIAVARATHPEALSERVRTLRTSAFAIGLPDRSVDNVFCIRLLHHVQNHEHRLKLLGEFRRVTRDTLIVSLWVGGNFKAWRRARRERKRGNRSDPNRVVIPAGEIEAEFAETGFTILGKFDFLPLYAMWRIYVLRRTDAVHASPAA